MKDKKYNHNLIAFENIINEKDLSNGNLILLASRPGIGKTKTCCDLFKHYSKNYSCLYFDLSGSASSYFFGNKEQNGLVFDFMSSIEMIKKIQNGIKYDNLKIVFIDYWQLLSDKNCWFINMLLEIYSKYKIVFIITSTLSRKIEQRRYHLPKIKDLKGSLFDYCGKCVVISRPYSYGESEEDKLYYLPYKNRFIYSNKIYKNRFIYSNKIYKNINIV